MDEGRERPREGMCKGKEEGDEERGEGAKERRGRSRQRKRVGVKGGNGRESKEWVVRGKRGIEE